MSDPNKFDNDSRQPLDAVSRAYRDARAHENASPPAALDNAIRAAARRAVKAVPQPVGKSWLRRWTPPLAVAAVVVLSVSVVFVAVEERPELAPASVQKITLARPTAPATSSSTTNDPGAIATKEKTVLAADLAAGSTPREPQHTQILDESAKRKRTLVPPPEVQISSPPIDAAKKEERGAVEKDRAAQLAGGQSLAPPAYAPRPAPAISAPAAQAIPPAAFPASESVARNESRADAPVNPIPEAKRLAEKAALTGAASARDAIGTAPKSAIANALPAPTAVASAASPAVVGAIAQSPLLKQLEQLGASADSRLQDTRPGPWLKRLLDLHEQNKLKELREELLRFQKAHPNVVLPKVLTEFAESRE